MKAERDQGVTKAEARKKAYRRLPALKSAKVGFDFWVDITYSQGVKDIAPSDYAAMVLSHCMANS